ncbi:kinase-like domain-containing protein, partial [Plectosphaerella plurivora]
MRDLPRGFRDKYVLANKLEKRANWDTFFCLDKVTGEECTVKVFRRACESDPRLDVSIEQEIRIIRLSHHPNIAEFRDVFQTSRETFLITEFAPQENLFDHIAAREKLPESDAREIFKQLFDAVKYLVSSNIIHRSITLENVYIIDKTPRVQLRDFITAENISKEGFAAGFMGAILFMAPEVCEDEGTGRHGKPADIWSLGLLLYTSLCGFHPFPSDAYRWPWDQNQVIQGVRFEYPSPEWDSVGDPAVDLIESMLAVDPEKRRTIEECAAHPWI